MPGAWHKRLYKMQNAAAALRDAPAELRLN
jgi:hypothetical protein